MRKHISALKTELNKTGQVPLDLYLSARLASMLPDPGPKWSEEAWALLCAQSHRWERVRFSKVPLQAYDALSAHKLPMLHTLSLRVDEEDGSIVSLPLHAFQHAPQITTVHILYYSPLLPFVLPHTWAITTLEIHCGNISNGELSSSIGAIVACSDTLRSLTVTADDTGTLTVDPIETTFPHLEQLTLGHEAIYLCWILVVPNVKDLTLSAWPDLHINATSGLSCIMALSAGCRSTRSLALRGLEPTDSRKIEFCLRRLPLLTELTLENNEGIGEAYLPLITMQLLEWMTRDAETPDTLSLLPNLARLEVGFRVRREDAADWRFYNALEALKRSRRKEWTVDGKQLAQLEHFTVDGQDALEGWSPQAWQA